MKTAMKNRERMRVSVEGRVQGVGFRPAVLRYARECRLGGWIANTSSGALIEIEGRKENIGRFIKKMENGSPALADISSARKSRVSPLHEKNFSIRPSLAGNGRTALIPPDICTCPECLGEFSDRNNRRYLYPFINCVNCGPRFTIAEDIPYDRANTTMKKFKMCPECLCEYNDPDDRRFHAQPNACPVCGPAIALLTMTGRTAAVKMKAARETSRLLARGRIGAIKGLGGFHLACDASNDGAVKRLRSRKYREDKPFALMAGDLDTVRKYCEVSRGEEKLLLSAARPIVLLKARPGAVGTGKGSLSAQVAPGSKYLGFMLPYTPLHHLIFGGLPVSNPGVLVMTSANISDEPICYENSDALSRMKKIADFCLAHDRPIRIRCDDSVARILPLPGGPESILRRSRGYVPAPLKLGLKFRKQVLACGAQLKNTFCLARDNSAFISHHIGDLENPATLESFEEGIAHFRRFFGITPEITACDMHPEYLSTKYALTSAPADKILRVQHHHAHIASCMAEHGLEKEKVIGVAFDGLGYGDDGSLWGGEFLVCGAGDYVRAAHLACVPMPGGAAAVKEPWRMACSYLRNSFGKDFPGHFRALRGKPGDLRLEKLGELMEKNISCPQTSSMGRLFDAVSSLLGIRQTVNYEGEAAIELEQSAAQTRPAVRTPAYHFAVSGEKPAILDAGPLIRDIVSDIEKGVPHGLISAKFHRAVAEAVLETCSAISAQTRIKKIALSGGVFQNIILLADSYTLLSHAGFRVYFNSKVPLNDGGISLGQAVVANASIR